MTFKNWLNRNLERIMEIFKYVIFDCIYFIANITMTENVENILFSQFN